jgi:predicted nucleotidyltransferase
MRHLHEVLAQRQSRVSGCPVREVADLETANRLKELALHAAGIRPSRIILFGSRARGDARPDSDFDLLILVPDITLQERRRYESALYRALAGAGVVAQPFVMSEGEFEETKGVIGGLARPAWKEGVILYENL